MNLMSKNVVARPVIIRIEEICRRQKELSAMPFAVYLLIVLLTAMANERF
jgi:hypothetical protein